MVVFGLYNGICVLPVLLSWLGPSAYLNARSGVALTSQQPAVSTQVGVKFYNFTSNEPTTDIEPHVVPQMDKTLQEKLLPLESIETGDIELGEMYLTAQPKTIRKFHILAVFRRKTSIFGQF